MQNLIRRFWVNEYEIVKWLYLEMSNSNNVILMPSN